MSDTELYQLAQASGYTFESLKKIKEAITSGNQAKITKAQNDLIKQQQDMELARQREARLAGGGTGGGTDTGGEIEYEDMTPQQQAEYVSSALGGQTSQASQTTQSTSGGLWGTLTNWWDNLWK